MSSFSWLDFSERDRRRALEVINLFRDRDTVDELGIGTIRDAFAELLLPGTSIIHTRARYFFFIPWMYLRLERRKVPSDRIAGEARKFEVGLVEALLASEDNGGTIGRLARSRLKILPSAIYWQALHRLGFRLFPGTRDQYHRSLDRFYANSGRAIRTDDGELVDRFRTRNWNSRLPEAPEDFARQAHMTMRPVEAEFLRDQIIYCAPKSLYRYLVEDETPLADAEFPWEYSGLSRLPAYLREQLFHARNFSEAIRGAPLLYNVMLSEMAKREEWRANYSERLLGWYEEYESRASDFAHWDRRRFWEIVGSSGARVTPGTRAFVERWLDLAASLSGPQLLESKEARRLILEREVSLKRAQSRLENQRALELWEGEAGTTPISYRWGIASQMVRDIFDGLSAGVVNA